MSSRSPSTVSSIVRLIARGSTGSPCHSSCAERQCIFLKHQAHGLEVEFRRQVEHGEIFVVERLRDLRLLVLALGEIVVELAMGLHVALDVHAHECGELHEAG